ncbi:MAG: Ig-like domain repeat protein, partial [Candidatus Diapherotrites archaeon]|nr:Ig-like domain repeat protein [Candidatus Diapherotrites archaeon]
KGGDVTDTVKKDVVAPTVTVDSLITSDNTPELTGTVDDAIATVEVTVNGTTYTATVSTTANDDGTYNWTADVTNTLSDGTYDVSVIATDQAGNVGNDNTSDELIIDTTAPTLDSITPENNSFVSGTQTFTFDFNDANLAYLEFDVYRPGDTEDTRVQVTLPADDSEIQSYQNQFANFGVTSASYDAAEQKWIINIDTADSFWPDGTTRFYIEVGDSAGNQWGDMNNDLRWGGLKLYTYTFDNTAPHTTLTVNPKNPDTTGWYNSNTGAPTITLSCDDSNGDITVSGCDKIYYKWDDGNYTEYDVSSSGIIALKGTHTLYYYSVDKAENSSAGNEGYEGYQEFKVDTQAPTVNAGNDKIANTEFTQDATVEDTNSKIASYSWEKISGPDGGTITFGSPNSEDTTISADKDGVYTIRLTVTDNAGNSNYDEMQLTWDTQDPTITDFDAPVADTVYKGDVPLKFTPSDTGSAVTCSYKIDDGSSVSVPCSSGKGVNTTITGLSDGRHSLALTVTDAAGNPVTSDLISFVVDLDNTLTVGSSGADFTSIQDAIDAATGGHIIQIIGDITTGQVEINKNITITGNADSKPVISPSVDLPTTNDVSGAWFLIDAGVTANINNVVLDGNGMKVWQGIRSHGITTIDNVDFKNIRDAANSYVGFAVAGFGGTIPGGAGSDTHSSGGAASVLTVTNSTFAQIGRIGILIKGDDSTAIISGNIYTGKGIGDFLDYAFEVGAGGSATIKNNTISNNVGVASSDGSTSAGILVTDYYGKGTDATITGNTITNCTDGIAVGYLETDKSVVVAHNNKFSGNDYGVNSTGPNVDATNNWWGDVSGPYNESTNIGGKGDTVSDNVDYRPWCADENCSIEDSDAPYIVGGIPTPSSVGIDPATNIEINFSEPVQCSNGDWSSCIT